MYFQILTNIILPNVGYWKGRKLVKSEYLTDTKNALCAKVERSSERFGRETIYELDDKIHREGDLPAIIHVEDNCETLKWYKKGKLHRDGDLPAVVYPYGPEEWYKNGKLHREGDLPAVEWRDGAKLWYKNGKLHREGNLPAVVYPYGSKEWWINGKLIKKEHKMIF